MKSVNTEAIVLKKRSLLGKDITLTLFSEELGKIRVLAKGIKKITSRRAPHIQTGNLITVELYRRDEYFYLQQSHLTSGFVPIKQDKKKMNAIYTFFFIIDRLLPENQQELRTYKLTKNLLIDATRAVQFDFQDLTPYLQQLLVLSGYLQDEKSFTELIRLVEEIIREKVPIHIV